MLVSVLQYKHVRSGTEEADSEQQLVRTKSCYPNVSRKQPVGPTGSPNSPSLPKIFRRFHNNTCSFGAPFSDILARSLSIHFITAFFPFYQKSVIRYAIPCLLPSTNLLVNFLTRLSGTLVSKSFISLVISSSGRERPGQRTRFQPDTDTVPAMRS
jgi:hypothetical protein